MPGEVLDCYLVLLVCTCFVSLSEALDLRIVITIQGKKPRIQRKVLDAGLQDVMESLVSSTDISTNGCSSHAARFQGLAPPLGHCRINVCPSMCRMRGEGPVKLSFPSSRLFCQRSPFRFSDLKLARRHG